MIGQGAEEFPAAKLTAPPVAVDHAAGNVAAHRDGVVQAFTARLERILESIEYPTIRLADTSLIAQR